MHCLQTPAFGPRTEKHIKYELPDTFTSKLDCQSTFTSTGGDTSYKSLITESELSIPTLVAELTLRRSVCQWYLYFLQVRFKSLVKVTVCSPSWVKSYKCLQLLTSSWSTTSRAQTHSTFHTNSHNSQCCQHQQQLQPTSDNTTRTRHQAGDHAPTHSRSTKKTC